MKKVFMCAMCVLSTYLFVSQSVWAQYTARQGETVVLALDYDPVEIQQVKRFVLQQAQSNAGPWITIALADPTSTRPLDTSIVINFSEGVKVLYFRSAAADVDGLVGEFSNVIDITRVLGPPKKPRIQ